MKFQIPDPKFQTIFGIWNLESGIWNLELIAGFAGKKGIDENKMAGCLL